MKKITDDPVQPESSSPGSSARRNVLQNRVKHGPKRTSIEQPAGTAGTEDDEIALAQSIWACARIHEFPEDLFAEHLTTTGSLQDIIDDIRHESQLSDCIHGPGNITFSNASCISKTSRVMSFSGKSVLPGPKSRRVRFESEPSEGLRRLADTAIRSVTADSSTFPENSVENEGLSRGSKKQKVRFKNEVDVIPN